ncbi:hypothetical protein ACH5RR_009082 [Cinchona calisaya]|uniref:UBN2 domain-containing protein n=1 Tax=Cinchona calisaya TaxID=153742 RepID=A0ABD3AD50_9GENT
MKHAISETFRGDVSEKATAKEFLIEIEKRFGKNDKVKISTILSNLISMRYKGKENIREYILEMFHLASKHKILKLELSDDLLVHLVLISLPAQFSQFKVSYNCQKDKWSLNELISHCVQEDERLKKENIESAHLVSTFKDKNKKSKKAKEAAGGPLQKKQQKKQIEEFSYYFCKNSRYLKNDCTKYHVWPAKKGALLVLVCSEVNLSSIPRHT